MARIFHRMRASELYILYTRARTCPPCLDSLHIHIGPKFQCRESWSQGIGPQKFFWPFLLASNTLPISWLELQVGNFDNFVILILAGVSLFSISCENFHTIPPLSPRIWKNLNGYIYTYIVENEPANNDGGNAGFSQPRRVSGFGMSNAGLTSRYRRVTWDLCIHI